MEQKGKLKQEGEISPLGKKREQRKKEDPAKQREEVGTTKWIVKHQKHMGYFSEQRNEILNEKENTYAKKKNGSAK